MYVCVWVCAFVCVCVCVCVYIYVHIYVCVDMYIFGSLVQKPNLGRRTVEKPGSHDNCKFGSIL